MSNYKTELQSNNADLQSIINQIDELGTIVTEQDGIIAQIHSALRGSGGTTVDDIGVFTIDDMWYNSEVDNGVFEDKRYSGIKFLFIKGMTFKDYYNSILNQPFYNSKKRLEICVADYGVSMENYPAINGVSSAYALSEDGEIFCDADNVIKEIKYKMKSIWDG